MINKDKEQLPYLIDDLIDADMVEVHANGRIITRMATVVNDLVKEVRASNHKRIILVLYDKDEDFDKMGLISRKRVMQLVKETIEMEE